MSSATAPASTITIGTDAATAAFIRSHLNDDIELLAAQQQQQTNNNSSNNNNDGHNTGSSSGPALRPSLPPACGATGTLPDACLAALRRGGGPVELYLQVVSVENVLLSREQRLRVLAPRQANAPGADAAANSTAGRSRNNGGDENEERDGENTASSSSGAGGGGGVMQSTLQMLEAAEEERVLERKKQASRARLLRLLLTDGFTRIIALEDTRPLVTLPPPPTETEAGAGGHAYPGGTSRSGVPAVPYSFPPPLFPAGVKLGEKVCVTLAPEAENASGAAGRARPAVQHGILRLHGGNARPLGGCVARLQRFAQAQAARALLALQGRPAALQPPPPSQQQQQPQQQQEPPSNADGGVPPPQQQQQGQQSVASRAPPCASPAAPNGHYDNNRSTTPNTTTVTTTNNNSSSTPPPPAVAVITRSNLSSVTDLRLSRALMPLSAWQQYLRGLLAARRQHDHHYYHQQQQQQHEQNEEAESGAWSLTPAPPPAEPLFITRAVVCDVLSDLLINEVARPHAQHTGVGSSSVSGSSSHHSSGGAGGATAATFSLYVALEAAEDPPTGVNDKGEEEEEGQLVVDLGDAWVSQTLGMSAAEFRQLTVAAAAATAAPSHDNNNNRNQNCMGNAQDLAPAPLAAAAVRARQQMEEAVNTIGYVLENMGPAIFVLGVRGTRNSHNNNNDSSNAFSQGADDVVVQVLRVQTGV